MTATTHTRTEIRHAVMEQEPRIGWTSTASSLGNTYLVDLPQFAHSRYGPNEFSDRHVYRYGVATSSNDRVRLALNLDTSNGYLYIDGGNYSNTTTLKDYDLLGMHPDEINAAIMRSQTKQVDRAIRALGTFTDSDMDVAGTDYWDGTSGGSAKTNMTVAKSTTDGYSGAQALSLTATGSGALVKSQRIRCPMGKPGWAGFILRADVGTVTVKIYDFTNSAYLTTDTRSYSGEDFAYVEVPFTTLSTTEEIQIEFSLSSASDVAIIDCVFGPRFADRRLFNLPSDLVEQYSVRYLRPCVFDSVLSTGVYDAYSKRDIGDYVNGQDFRVESFPRSINPFRVNIDQGVEEEFLNKPMWVVCERPLSDKEPLDSETAVTSAPFNQVVAYALAEVVEIIRGRNQDVPYWEKRFNETRIDAAIERLARPAAKQQQKTTVTRLRA